MRWQLTYGNRPWHRWFAWYPVHIDRTDTMVWGEWIERRKENVQGRICTYYQDTLKP